VAATGGEPLPGRESIFSRLSHVTNIVGYMAYAGKDPRRSDDGDRGSRGARSGGSSTGNNFNRSSSKSDGSTRGGSKSGGTGNGYDTSRYRPVVVNEETTAKPQFDSNAGWEVSVRKTVPVPVADVWTFLIGAGLALWLGDTKLPKEKGAAFVTDDGVRGTLRLRTEGSRVRITWQPSDWPHDTNLALTVKDAEPGTIIEFHHEDLTDRDERRMMLGHWKNVLEQLAVALDRL
jgi:uncharacterized protein YndB with AHSA1/START domain